MEKRQLTGIEREFVLKYLRDEDVPLTIMDSQRLDVTSEYPVAVKSGQLSVLEKGVVLLRDAPDSVAALAGKSVRIQFYFNKLGLYFDTELRKSGEKLYVVVPQGIFVLEDKAASHGNSIKAILRFPGEENSGYQIEAFPAKGFDPFSAQEGGASSGKEEAHQLAISRYLSQRAPDSESRVPPLEIIFVDDEKIVFARRSGPLEFKEGEDYSLNLLAESAPKLPPRSIMVRCVVKKIFTSEDAAQKCAVCGFDGIKEEDSRFLYEKSRGKRLE